MATDLGRLAGVEGARNNEELSMGCLRFRDWALTELDIKVE